MNQKEKLIELLKIICECPEETCPRKDRMCLI